MRRVLLAFNVIAFLFACIPGVANARFMQVDPVGYEDQNNLYAYVGNDPLNKTDPTGMQSVDDMQLHAQIEDMRQQGMTEQQIHQEIGRQSGIQGTALGTVLPGSAITVSRGAILPILRFVAPRLTSPAFRVAASGGKHSPMLRQFIQRTNTQLQRTIRGHERQIREHREKIQNPEKFMQRDYPSDPAAVERALKDWQETIKRHEELRDIAQDGMRTR